MAGWLCTAEDAIVAKVIAPVARILVTSYRLAPGPGEGDDGVALLRLDAARRN